MNLLKPTIYSKDIFSINYSKLKEKGIKLLLFDIDNTIAKIKDKNPSSNTIKLFNDLKKDFKVVIITNAVPHRALRFKRSLLVDTFSLACKPSKHTYLRIIKKYKFKTNEIAAIGDQIYTDIKDANKLKISSILVDQISKQESIFTKINRIKENNLINKRKIIERGKYYD